MSRILALGALLIGLGVGLASPAAAGEPAPTGELCYWCIRDAIYADISLIGRLEANPDIDESVKEPQIVAARADIHRLRVLLGPLVREAPELCCYSRPRLYVR
jgi:hypothetical protein